MVRGKVSLDKVEERINWGTFIWPTASWQRAIYLPNKDCKKRLGFAGAARVHLACVKSCAELKPELAY